MYFGRFTRIRFDAEIKLKIKIIINERSVATENLLLLRNQLQTINQSMKSLGTNNIIEIKLIPNRKYINLLFNCLIHKSWKFQLQSFSKFILFERICFDKGIKIFYIKNNRFDE